MKKMISILIAAIVGAIMLAACTPSGMPISLVGMWKSETKTYEQTGGYYDRTTDMYVYEYSDDTTIDVVYMEITDDDYMITASTKEEISVYKQDKKQCQKIVKATCNELYIKSGRQASDDNLSITQYELVGNTLTLKNAFTVRVYTKE